MGRLTRVTAPATTFLAWEDEVETHIRVDTEDEKVRIMEVVVPAAATWLESATNRALITQKWQLKLDGFPGSICDPYFVDGRYGTYIVLPKPPLIVSDTQPLAITYLDSDGATQTLATTVYSVDKPVGDLCSPARIYLKYGQTWPSTLAQYDAVTITFYCGYGPESSDVPGALRQAGLLLVGENYERREDGNEIEITRIPLHAANTATAFLVEI